MQMYQWKCKMNENNLKHQVNHTKFWCTVYNFFFLTTVRLVCWPTVTSSCGWETGLKADEHFINFYISLYVVVVLNFCSPSNKGRCTSLLCCLAALNKAIFGHTFYLTRSSCNRFESTPEKKVPILIKAH